MRWVLPIVPRISVGSRFLFGGAALGAATAVLEATTDRPVVWATAQYLSFAPVDSVMDLDVTIAVTERVTKPSAKRSAVRSVNRSSALAARPSTVPAAHSAAAPRASRAAWALDTVTPRGWGKARSQAPPSAGAANQR